MSEHARVEEFLRSFDVAATKLPIARRRLLRAEIAAHLHEVVSPEATDDEARLALLEFGTPVEIVAQEGVTAPVKARSRWMLVAVAALAVAAVVAVVIVNRPSAPTTEEQPVTAATYDSVVRANPEGFERETEGDAFRAYASEAGQLPALPPGAEWPAGVQAGLNEGLTPDGSGVMEGGAGVWQARYIWLCAWEWEYLNASTLDDTARKATAIEAFDVWISSDFWADVDPDGAWGRSLFRAMEERSLRDFKIDFTDTCMKAGILGVQYSY